MINLSADSRGNSPLGSRVQEQVPRCKTPCNTDYLAANTIARLTDAYQCMNHPVSDMSAKFFETYNLAVIRPQALVLKLAAESSSSVSQFLASIPKVFVMQRLLTDPFKYYDELPNTNFLKVLDYCPCAKLSANSRMRLQNRVLNLIERTVPKESPITIVSIGAGGCYQELVYLSHLASAGYKIINVVLVERENLKNTLAVLLHFCKNYIPTTTVSFCVTINLEKYTELEKSKDGLKPDLLLMLDLDEPEYNIDGKNLTDYSFEFLNKNRIIKNGSVIAYSSMPRSSKPIWFPTIISCSYDGSGQLDAIQADRIEELVHPNGVRYFKNSCGGPGLRPV